MGKTNKQTKKATMPEPNQKHSKLSSASKTKNEDFIWSMSMAPRLQESFHWFQMVPVILFTACVITIVRLHSYTRPMSQFYWTNSGNDLTDFFSFYKMEAIILCAVLALVILLYRIFSQSMAIKRTPYYIPITVYSLFVLFSYFMSDYKEFALWGWNDRFEGTVTLLTYMFMLFYIINTVNNEKNVKCIIYILGIVSTLLSLLGITQASGHDFFKTLIGKKLITPSSYWNNLDQLTFTFHKEIYQTVYNINYVSFYLTLLLPLFGLLFIYSMTKGKAEPVYKKLSWGVLFALTIYNLIGSQSSGGFLGMGIVVLISLVILNKKIINWWRPVSILIVITLLVGGITYNRWMPEISGASKSVLGIDTQSSTNSEVPGSPKSNDLGVSTTTSKGYIDYIVTKGSDIIFNYKGNELTFTTYPENPVAIKLTDAQGKDLDIKNIEGSQMFTIADDRFASFVIGPAEDSAGTNYFIINVDDSEWDFAIIPGKDVQYRNTLGNLVSLTKVPAIGWEDNQNFGSGRGYIWSRTIPMFKDTILLGHGADTYCIYFPQNDYVGKYNADWGLNLIVDKPHNMYFATIVNTGMISLLALMVLWFTYIFQSIKIYGRRDLNSFIDYAGIGVFLGICGFLVSAFVDDSSVSVMPMFYGLLGTGIAINIMLKKQMKETQNN
ncbi:O-antigen ligase family protein [Clostridium aminobutyricum]|uniref:O-antigen ligase family protein n=1 Tax=Clostridium aminobutyricum TaxID=33953 RepID=A0A939IJY0_CLOAM|nr:O-antigen ligase family protein [Clostridium aminobutyricum]MBN7774058.1 O-antigen ligase family protein [Clostridium aminobutyricum]